MVRFGPATYLACGAPLPRGAPTCVMPAARQLKRCLSPLRATDGARLARVCAPHLAPFVPICGIMIVYWFDVTLRRFEVILHRFDVTLRRFDVTLHRFDVTLHWFDVVLHWFDVTLQRFEVILHRFDVTLQQFEVILHRFDVTLQSFEVILHRFDVTLHWFDVVLQWFNVTLQYGSVVARRSNVMDFYKKMRLDKFLAWAQVALDNVRNIPEIAASMAAYGYDAPRIQEGVSLLTQARQLQAAQVRCYGEQYLATEALNRAWKQADETYATQRKLVRLALRHSPARLVKLELDGRKKRGLADWLGQATVFYTGLLEDAEALAVLARFNLTATDIEAGQTMVAEVAELNSAQEQAKYAAQQATQTRDAAPKALNDWMVEFSGVARIALVGALQQLEALQIAVVA